MTINTDRVDTHYYYKSHDIDQLIRSVSQSSPYALPRWNPSKLVYKEVVILPDDSTTTLTGIGDTPDRKFWHYQISIQSETEYDSEGDPIEFSQPIVSSVVRSTYDLLSSNIALIKDRYLSFCNSTIHVFLDENLNITPYIRVYADKPVIDAKSGSLLDISWKNDYIENVIAIQKLINGKLNNE